MSVPGPSIWSTAVVVSSSSASMTSVERPSSESTTLRAYASQLAITMASAIAAMTASTAPTRSQVRLSDACRGAARGIGWDRLGDAGGGGTPIVVEGCVPDVRRCSPAYCGCGGGWGTTCTPVSGVGSTGRAPTFDAMSDSADGAFVVGGRDTSSPTTDIDGSDGRTRLTT